MANKPASATPSADHEETYDEWFLRKVDEAVAAADQPDAVWHSHEDGMRDWEEQRRELLAMMEKK